MEQLAESSRQQTKLLKIICLFVMGIFLVLALCAALLVPKALKTLDDAQTAMQHADTVLSEADTALQNLNQVAENLNKADLPGLVSSTQDLITQSSSGLEEALNRLNSIDIDTLNSSIASLQAVVKPLAALFGH